VKQAALAARGVAIDTEVCGARHVSKTRYHREIASRVRGKHTLLAYIPWQGRIAAAIKGRTMSSTRANGSEPVERIPSHAHARRTLGSWRTEVALLATGLALLAQADAHTGAADQPLETAG
jgi:hypothetical protein